ncbi:MAG TPA: flagellar basal body L-ring protein FlgH [Burkholderiaceae bacterium]
MNRQVPMRGRGLRGPVRAGAMLVAAAFMLPAVAQKLFDAKTYHALAADRKAVAVGDILTVQVFEQSSASTTTDTTTQRTNALGASLSIANSGLQHGGSISQSGSFDGGGTTERANKLLVTLSVTVREVLPNGDLLVRGEQSLTVNKEEHKVLLEGRVRPQDVGGDNTVLSTRLADAHIEYVGDGDLSDRQTRAWWRHLLDILGL